MNKLTNLYKAAIRSIFGYEFMVWHLDADGARKIFHCKTYEEALEWVSCALNCSSATVVDRNGYFVCQRFPIA